MIKRYLQELLEITQLEIKKPQYEKKIKEMLSKDSFIHKSLEDLRLEILEQLEVYSGHSKLTLKNTHIYQKVLYLKMNEGDFKKIEKSLSKDTFHLYHFLFSDLNHLPQFQNNHVEKQDFIQNIVFDKDKISLKNEIENFDNIYFIKKEIVLNNFNNYLNLSDEMRKNIGPFFAFRDIKYPEHFKIMRDIFSELNSNFNFEKLLSLEKNNMIGKNIFEILFKKSNVKEEIMNLSADELIDATDLSQVNQSAYEKYIKQEIKRILESSVIFEVKNLNIDIIKNKSDIELFNSKDSDTNLLIKYFYDFDINEFKKKWLQYELLVNKDARMFLDLLDYKYEGIKQDILNNITIFKSSDFSRLMREINFTYEEVKEVFKQNPLLLISVYHTNILENSYFIDIIKNLDKEDIYEKSFKIENNQKSYLFSKNTFEKLFVVEDFFHFFIEKDAYFFSLKEKLTEKDKTFIKKLALEAFNKIGNGEQVDFFTNIRNENLKYSLLSLLKPEKKEIEIKNFIEKQNIKLNKCDIKEIRIFQKSESIEKYLSKEDKKDIMQYKKLFKQLELDKTYMLKAIGDFIDSIDSFNQLREDFDINLKLMSKGFKYNPKLIYSKEFCLYAFEESNQIEIIKKMPEQFFYDIDFMNDFTKKLGDFDSKVNFFPSDIKDIFIKINSFNIDKQNKKDYYTLFQEYQLFLIPNEIEKKTKKIKL